MMFVPNLANLARKGNREIIKFPKDFISLIDIIR